MIIFSYGIVFVLLKNIDDDCRKKVEESLKTLVEHKLIYSALFHSDGLVSILVSVL